MFAFIARLFGTLIGGVYLSVFSMVLFGLMVRRPGHRRGGFFRRFLRGSYMLYSSLFNWIRPTIMEITTLDLLENIPRILLSIVLSFGIGWGILQMLDWQMETWFAIALISHGLIVGWSWDQIVIPQNFQMGDRLE